MSKAVKNEYTLSFLISVLVVTAAFITAGVYPFGGYTSCCSDMRIQFINQTACLYERLRNAEGIFVSYSGALGMNFFPSVFFMLLYPDNLLYFLFDTILFQEVTLVITIFRLGLIALCTSVYLKNSRYTALSGRMNIALSVLYSVCNYMIRIITVPSWLPIIALMPIVLLGVERTADKQKPGLLLISFSVCVVYSMYIAYMTGLFALLYFIFYYTVFHTKNGIDTKHLAKTVFLCFLCTILSLGISGIVLLPFYSNTVSVYAGLFEKDMFSEIFRWSLSDFSSAFTLMPDGSVTNSGPYGFFGIMPLLFTLMLISSSFVNKKERIAAGVFTAIMVLSIAIKPLYLMWHMFREPVGFFCRFMYAAVFLFIILCARFVSLAKKPQKAALIIPFPIILFLLSAALKSHISASMLLNASADVIFALAYFMICKRAFDNKKLISGIVFAEALFIAVFGIAQFKKGDAWGPRNSFPDELKKTKALVNAVDDSGFYRMTNVSSEDVCLPLSAGYNALETFSSQTNQKSLSKLSQLGVWCPHDYRIVNHYFNSIVSDSLFNIKYIMISDRNNIVTDEYGRQFYARNGAFTDSQRLASKNYRLIHEGENGRIYENTSVFPLMFAVDEAAVTADKRFYDKADTISGAYRNQAIFLNDMFGTDYELYSELSMTQDEPLYAVKSGGGEWDSFTLTPAAEHGYLGYSYTADEDGEYCIDARIDYSPANSFLFAVNQFPLDCAFSTHNQMLNTDIGPYKKGDKITAVIQTDNVLSLNKPLLLRLNADEFDDIKQRARANALNDIKLEKNMDISAVSDFDSERLIFGSISYDNGFHVYIDGKETEKVKIADAFLGFRVPAGRHDITVKYVSPGFYEGIAVSFSFILVSAVFLLTERRKNKNIK
ncbi:MAG: YfhO family protein [Firmicutes bacterium]|nr:YfhO family protein [Bacillota bacterium]